MWRRTPNIHLIRFQKEKNKPEATFEEIIAENFPELMKDRHEWTVIWRMGESDGDINETQLLKHG